MVRKFRKFLGIIAVLSLIAGIGLFFLTGGYRHNILPLISSGEKYLGEEDYADAELAFNRAVNIDSRSARAFYGRARSDIGLGQNDNAVSDLQQVAQLASDKNDKVQWMIDKINAGEGNDLILLPYKTDVTSDEEFADTPITSDDREIVIVLDTSGSMDGSPLEATQKASSSFIHTILKEYADVGTVTFSDDAAMVSDFTMNADTLDGAIGGITSGGGTATGTGLNKAYEMLSKSGARQKIIVLMSDGQSGDDPTQIAQTIKDSGITIYTLGFFDMAEDIAGAQAVMEDVASEGCHYEVDSEGGLRNFFDDIASQINGQKYYYLRIACPVDVCVKYKGETLSSKGAVASKRTSFGTLTFEQTDDNTDAYSSDEDSQDKDERIKVLRLKEGVDYDIDISGNGKGKMNYTIGFMDDDGDYTDMRKFKSIPVTKKTEIST